MENILSHFYKNLGNYQRYAQDTLALLVRGQGEGYGFTLAEVLITLGIIGIVASLTIPTLMNNVQQFEFHVAAKKEYSVLSQAYTSILSDNSGSLAGVCSDDVCINDLFKDKMKYSKVCDIAGDNSCFATTLYNYNGTINYIMSNNTIGMVLNDGTSLWVIGGGYTTCDATSNVLCSAIAFDVNGLKKPNAWGKDIYSVGIYKNKLSPKANSYFGGSYMYDVLNNIDY